MDLALAEQTLKELYRDVSGQYRRDDEIEVTTERHRRLERELRSLSGSFGASIDVLEAGCGTGRYFHCLDNVRRLVGIDLCPEMIEAARHPVREELITAQEIQLFSGTIHDASFEPESFDFIFSLGMFGNGCPFTVDICNRFYDWLRPEGKLFFNTIDITGVPWPDRMRKSAKRLLYPVLPQAVKAQLDERERRHPFFPLSRKQVEKILRTSRFQYFDITRHKCDSHLWRGTHLEVIAWKPGNV
jgi:SAM-dependent methyltransferase